ncbi:hypothetical protein [Christiangramia echinicola]|uniref:hypothetical protein n=1 Tax=Christiangramia echinicola TaxID=279359 RepID=UPI0004170B43|nr:hypothetical protein [Christiangramia echinicola]
MKIERFIKFVPLGTIFLTIISGIKLSIYYSQFNIKIFDFIELNEIITLFFDDILYYLLLLSVLLIIYLLLKSYSNFSLSKEPQTFNFPSDPKAKKLWNRHMNIMAGLAIFVFFGLSTMVILSTFELYIKIDLIKINILTFLSVGLLYSAHKNWLKNLNSALILYSGLLIAGFLISESFLEAEKIKSGITKQIFKIKTVNHTYTNQEYSYLGKSNNYIFIFDKIDESSLIIPTSKLERINLKQ